MKLYATYLLYLLVLLVPLGTWGQATDGRTITGQITDANGQPLAGATVSLLSGTSTTPVGGTLADAQGRFSLQLPTAADGYRIAVTYVGYARQTIAITAGQITYDVRLAEDNTTLDEVVVVAYGTQRRAEVTAAVSELDVAQARSTRVATLGEALQGRVAGINVTSSGQPGQVSQIQVRGPGNFGNNQPLFVVDGVWLENGDNRDINWDDVENVTVLKDAAAASLYGSRAANGVVVITTRKGQSGPARITLDASVGWDQLDNQLDLANSQQFRSTIAQARANAGLAPILGTSENFNPGVDTDWQDEILQTGFRQSYNLGLSGGGESGTYYIGVGRFQQDGTLINTGFERTTLRINTEFKRGRFTVGENAQLSYSSTLLQNGLPFIDVVRMAPNIPVRNPDGSYGTGTPELETYGTNPVGLQELYRNNQQSWRILGNAYGEVRIFDFLKYRINLGLEYHSFFDRNAQPAGALRYQPGSEQAVNRLFEQRGDEVTTLIENLLTYQQSFEQHNIEAFVAYSEQQFRGNFLSGNQSGVPSNTYYFSSGSIANPTLRGGPAEWARRSYFGRINYNYAGRYFINYNYRNDEDSRFGPNNRQAGFNSGSVGWRISEEAFFEPIRTTVSDLKLRASYGELGITGSANPYEWQSTVNRNAITVLNGNQITPGATATFFANPDLKWQTNRQWDIGLDAALLDNRLSVTVDYYNRDIEDVLVPIDLPFIQGGGVEYRRFLINAGELRNTGWEFQLGWTQAAADRNSFGYSISANLTTLDQEVIKLAEERGLDAILGGLEAPLTRTQAGRSIGEFYLIQEAGIYRSDDEAAAGPSFNGRQPVAGDVRYIDQNGDGVINDDDRVFAGSSIPDLNYGINITLNYRGFDLSIFGQGVAGGKVFNNTRWWTDRNNDLGNVRSDLDPWSPTNPNGRDPRLVYGDQNSANSLQQSTRWLESGDYFRLRVLSLGYTFPSFAFGETIGLNRLRLYVTGQNLFTITPYRGLNPEVIGTGTDGFTRGIDDGNYPVARTFLVGVQVGF